MKYFDPSLKTPDGWIIGPFAYHPPLPKNASWFRRTRRRVYEFFNTLLYWSTRWL